MVLNSNDIISRLKNKNMSFADENKAKDFFDTNSYYRFRGYFYYLLKDMYQGIKKYDSILNHLPSGYGFFDNWQQDTFWTN